MLVFINTERKIRFVNNMQMSGVAGLKNKKRKRTKRSLFRYFISLREDRRDRKPAYIRRGPLPFR